MGAGQGHVVPHLGDLVGGGTPSPWLLISHVFGVYGMTLKGKMRNFGDKFCKIRLRLANLTLRP